MGELKYLNKFFYHYRKRIITGIIITIVARIFALVAPNLVGYSITLIEEYSLKNSIDMDFLKKGLLKKFGTAGEKEGEFIVEGNNREPFSKEMNDLLNIEHDLETEILPWPKQLEDGFSAADLNVMEIFFNLDEFEPKEEEPSQEE